MHALGYVAGDHISCLSGSAIVPHNNKLVINLRFVNLCKEDNVQARRHEFEG